MNDLLEKAQNLINQLPDCTIDWARDGIGHTNAGAILFAREELSKAIAKVQKPVEIDEYAAKHLEHHMEAAGIDVAPMIRAKTYLREHVLSTFLDEDQTFVNGGKRWQVYSVLLKVEDPAVVRGYDWKPESEDR